MLPYIVGAIIFMIWAAGFLVTRRNLEWVKGTSTAKKVYGTFALFLLWWLVALDMAGKNEH